VVAVVVVVVVALTVAEMAQKNNLADDVEGNGRRGYWMGRNRSTQ
jgi:hypothetical protein